LKTHLVSRSRAAVAAQPQSPKPFKTTSRAAPAKKPAKGKAQLRAALEEEITSGLILPGQRLDESELCARFGVSRTPVREALLQLASLGLVEFQPRRGASVARLTVQEIVAMWEVLTAMESFGTSLAARRMTGADRQALLDAHEASREFMDSNDVLGYEHANRTFHDMLYKAFRNPYLAAQVTDIRRRLRAYGRFPFQRPGGIARSFAGHQKVVDAVLAGDDEGAASAMREHISGGLTFLDFLVELPQAMTSGDVR
jgi:DNA-binding GntR family transcriptional regulator